MVATHSVTSDPSKKMESLDDVAALSDQKHKIEQYRAALQRVLDSGSIEQCKEFVNHSTCCYSSKSCVRE